VSEREGTRVTAEDIVTGEREERIILNDYVLIVDGDRYIDGIQAHANGTHVLTVKRRPPDSLSEPRK